MPGIFISYRRDDTAGHAGRLFDRMIEHFGRERVFMDVDTIQPGQDFAEVIGERVRSSGAVIVLIGKEWLLATDASGNIRLNDPADFVRLEIASALQQSTPVIPVLVEDAAMPRAEDLPQPLQALARHQALTISDARFHAEAADLIRVLERYVPPGEAPPQAPDQTRKPGRWRAATATAVIVCILAAGTYWWHAAQGKGEISGRWQAELSAPGEKPLAVLLDLEAAGTKLLGTVSYPTGESGIRDGIRNGNHISFQTQHIPQFETQPVIIRFEGELAGNELKLVMQTDQGIRRLTAVRTQ
jgi:hypothetical protein